MQKRGFRSRIMFAIVAIAIIAIAIIEIVFYDLQKNEIIDSYIENVESREELQADRFDQIMKELYRTMQSIRFSDELQEAITVYQESSHGNQDALRLSSTMQKLLSGRQSDDTLYLYLEDDETLFTSLETYPSISLGSANLFTWKNHSSNPFTPLFYMNYFTDSAEYVYGYAATMMDSDDNEFGMLCLTINERDLYYDLLSVMNKNEQGEKFYLVNDRGLICSAEDVNLRDSLNKEMKKYIGSKFSAHTLQDGSLLVMSQIPSNCYNLVCISDMSAPNVTLQYLFASSIIMLLVIAVGLTLAAVLVTLWLYRPMEELLRIMEKVQEGDFTARVSGAYMEDEFGIVGIGFNDLMDHMDELMENVVQERMSKREAEVNALQYQIRPHFMYNTLNSIRFAAVMQKNNKLAELLGNFINLLEASIQRKGAFISLKDEMKLVEDFLALQSFRYMDCFHTRIRIDEEAEACYVPCLLLQPMVENAVFHGIDTTRDDNMLTIMAWVREDMLYIFIHDNGLGMQENEGKNEKRRLTGIGLENVRQRMELYYGAKAGYQIFSGAGKGTTVKFYLPVSHDPDEYSLRKGRDEV